MRTYFSHLFILLYIATVLVSCSIDVSDNVNIPPKFISVIGQLTIEKDSSLLLTLEVLEAHDANGDIFTLIVHETAENYSIEGNRIIPAKGYIGILQVPIQLFDGELHSSIETISISVVNNKTIVPLQTGNRWTYSDYSPGSNSIIFSNLEVFGKVDYSPESSREEVYRVQWTNTDELDLSWLMYNSDQGTYLHGGVSPTDTFFTSQLYKYPVQKGDSWPFSPLKYNATDGKFFEGDPTTMICLNNPVYITVPAGTFRCIEYSYSYKVESHSRSFENTSLPIFFPLGIMKNRSGDNVITEKLYYSEGVGYVQKLTIINSETVWIKELNSYTVL